MTHLGSASAARGAATRWSAFCGWLFAALLLPAFALAIPSCAAPSLPIPPPTALVEGPPDADGMVLVTGNARPGTFVAGLNERTEQGTITRADVVSGDYELRLAAEVHDELRIWQFEASSPGGEPRFVVVPE